MKNVRQGFGRGGGCRLEKSFRSVCIRWANPFKWVIEEKVLESSNRLAYVAGVHNAREDLKCRSFVDRWFSSLIQPMLRNPGINLQVWMGGLNGLATGWKSLYENDSWVVLLSTYVSLPPTRHPSSVGWVLLTYCILQLGCWQLYYVDSWRRVTQGIMQTILL